MRSSKSQLYFWCAVVAAAVVATVIHGRLSGLRETLADVVAALVIGLAARGAYRYATRRDGTGAP
ncbi:hypothetical protein AB0K09_20610 [Streptomyces sp. NPDC049577]|uniref:hypothetical protein n=1 Tax=Streptomyces sp. NPDC049577 TaxID=3155153 RepID=UPI00342B7F72